MEESESGKCPLTSIIRRWLQRSGRGHRREEGLNRGATRDRQASPGAGLRQAGASGRRLRPLGQSQGRGAEAFKTGTRESEAVTRQQRQGKQKEDEEGS